MFFLWVVVLLLVVTVPADDIFCLLQHTLENNLKKLVFYNWHPNIIKLLL